MKNFQGKWSEHDVGGVVTLCSAIARGNYKQLRLPRCRCSQLSESAREVRSSQEKDHKEAIWGQSLGLRRTADAGKPEHKPSSESLILKDQLAGHPLISSNSL